MPFIDVIGPDKATGELKEIYYDLLEKRGKIAEVHKIQSLNPSTIVHHMNLYLSVMYGSSPIKRVHRELMGVIVSRYNNCEYCVEHHAEAVNHYWKDETKLRSVIDDHMKADISGIEKAMCEYAKVVTVDPGAGADGSAVSILRDQGMDDRSVLDATLVCAYFNFVNRMVLILGVELEEDGGKGYKY